MSPRRVTRGRPSSFAGTATPPGIAGWAAMRVGAQPCRATIRAAGLRRQMVDPHRYDRCDRSSVGVSMELRHLRYFVALAECLSFTRAADRVHVTQSTLSHQIRQLEDEIGQRLFERIGKPASSPPRPASSSHAFAVQRAAARSTRASHSLRAGRRRPDGAGAGRRDAHLQRRPSSRECVALFLAAPSDRSGAASTSSPAEQHHPAVCATGEARHRHRLSPGRRRPTSGSSRSTTRRWCSSSPTRHPLARSASGSAWSSCTSNGWCCCRRLLRHPR